MAPSELSLLFRQCLHKRIKAAEFVELLRFAGKKRPVKSKDVVAALLNCAFKFCLDNDPLVSQYLQSVVTAGFASSSDFITALILQWKKLRKSESSDFDGFLQTSSRLINDLSFLATTNVAAEPESRRCIILASRWLQALTKWASDNQGKEIGQHSSMLVEAVGLLLVSHLASLSGNAVMTAAEGSQDDHASSAVQKAVDACMDTFPNISMQLIERIQKHPGLLNSSQEQSGPDNSVLEMAALEFEANIRDAQIVPTRTATQILLQSLISAGSTIDDAAICAYLSNRYSGSNALMFNDLIFASFNAMTKSPDALNETYRAQCRIFLHNKLPSILSFISQLSSFESLPSEQFLMELWNEVSTVNDESNVAEVRHFLQVCVLHHLISSETVSTLLVSETGAASLKGLFPKDALVGQVNDSASRGPRLVDELLKNDGNAGSVSYAIMEVMHKYCQTKETTPLKDMATALVRKPASINTIAMFIKPAVLLTPLCNMLDEWNWNEIHGESQPVYDEFGSVLLLIMSFQRRLSLRESDLRLFKKDGFLATYLSSGHAEQDLFTLPEDQQTHVGDWINALYMADGLSDDLTTSCSAKDFYLLIPTILRQSVTAIKLGKLSEDTMKAGLEYLLEPFLLPSLLTAFSWLTSIAETDAIYAFMIAQVLTKTPGSAEASELHKSIMAMASEFFRKKLSHVSDLASLQDLFTLLNAFGPFGIREPIKEADLTMWSGEDGGILSTLQRSITGQFAVPSQGFFQPNLVLATVQLRGPIAVGQAIVTLLVQFSGSHDFHQLLDLVATLVAGTDNQGISLRNGVQISHSRIGSMIKKGDNLRAEALVHLARRVEIYGNALTPQSMNIEQNMMPMTGVDIANINLDAVPVSNLDSQQQLQSVEQPDQMVGEDMDQMLKEAAAMGTVDQIDTNLNDTDMFDFTADNYDDLGNLDDLDLNMFS